MKDLRSKYEEVSRNFLQNRLLDGYHHFRRMQIALLFLVKINLTENSLILDAGCGDGIQASRMSQKYKVIGIDFSSIRINRAKKRAPRASFVVGDLYNLPFRNEIFDAIVMGEVIEHLHYPKTALVELNEVLRKRGHLILDVPSKSNVIDIFLRAIGREPIWGLHIDKTHVNFYDERALMRLLSSSSGFRVLDVRGGPCLRYDLLGKVTWSKHIWWLFKITDKFSSAIPVVKRKGAIQVYLCQKSIRKDLS